MALVKTTQITPDAGPRFTPAVVPAAGNGHAADKQHRDADQLRRKARTVAKQQQAAERIAAATAELSKGVTEASGAAEELKAAMQQIATGAAESSSAAQESQAAIVQIAKSIGLQKQQSELSLTRTQDLQAMLQSLSGDIDKMVTNVGQASERQTGSVVMVEELEKRANDIGEIVKAVGRIADQTNLLALNAAIEAARAGQHGKGFAVVADEVRTLAETSEKSARDIQGLVKQIQDEVRVISDGISGSATAAKAEVEKGRAVNAQLEQARDDIGVIARGAQEIAVGAAQSDSAAANAQKGSEVIAAAAEEQAAACEEALKTVGQQNQALAGGEQAAQNLSGLADELKNSTDITKSAEEVAAVAEELSSSVQEMTRAAAEIMAAIDQISKGAQQQSAATAEASAAATQIEKGAQIAEERAKVALDRGQAMVTSLGDNKKAVDEMVSGLTIALDAGKKSQEQMNALELLSRRIDKIVDAIVNVSIQTNMLAVNGAVEAARAGEYGKGFAVVSTDIRNLARESAENAERIKDVVKAVQDQIGAVRRDLEEIGAAAGSEVEKARGITNGLVKAADGIGVVVKGNGEIQKASAEIVTALLQAKKGLEQISAASEEASKAAAEAATAAKQQSQGATELASAIEEIASLADELQSN